MPGGEDLFRCLQCGTCSSTCPLSIYMDLTPRRVIAMTRAGFKDDVLRCNTIWLCASCYSCTVDCPKQIKITDIMYGLKRRAMEEGVYPAKFPIPVLAEEFFKSVTQTGRSNERKTVTRVFLKTAPMKLLKNMGLGLKLMKRGRMSLKGEVMEGDPGEIQKLMDAVDRASNAQKQESRP